MAYTTSEEFGDVLNMLAVSYIRKPLRQYRWR